MSTPALQALIRLLDDTPDASVVTDPDSWKLIQKYSGAYGVRSLAAFAALPFASADSRAWCERVLANNRRRHEQSLLHLEGILALLERAGIRALVLKGPLLARRYYSPPFLRKASVDLDLAIRAVDIERACALLAGLGYEQKKTVPEARAYSYDVGFLHASMPRVELHFRLSHGVSGIPVEEFFERAAAVELPGGGTAWVLDDVDGLLHLVLHYAHHRFPMLFNLHEIRRIWRATPDGVRQEVIRKAQQHHFLAPFLMTDIAFRETWGEAFLPPGMVLPKTWLHWRIDPRLYRQCVRWSQPGFQLTLANRLQGRLLDFQLTDHPSDALKFFRMFANVAWYRLRQRGWRTQEYRHFAEPAGRS